ncbi:MAG: ATP-binding protein [Clostridia bacterium]|nr:ATP-binding protein [Clostridia bacterium]
MERLLTEQLNQWRQNPRRKPLVLKGVRHCGKTWLLKAFGEQHYPDVAVFNFEENPGLCRIFEQDLCVKRILLELGITRGKAIQPGDTLIILDEIQACGKALTALKYFNENAPEYHIACTASLLWIAPHENQSFPVGKVDFLTLYPMSFEEFLIVMDQRMLTGYLASLELGQNISEPIASQLTSYLRQYFMIGGMPEVVRTWKETQDLTKAESVQQAIVSSYELDFARYAPHTEFPKLSAVWASIPQQLSKPNNKFIFSHVKKGWRAKDLANALEWLIRAGLLHRVCMIEKPYIPLSAYADVSSFKLYLCDIGLLRKLAGVPAEAIFSSSDLYKEFRDAMTENYVLTELLKTSADTVYYWTSGNMAEVDFVVQQGVEIVPIEVKSENSVKIRSLAEYRKKYNQAYAVRTSMVPELINATLLNIPLFMIHSLPRWVTEQHDWIEGWL